MIGVMADTHDHRTMTRRAVRIFSDRRVTLVIHAGDFVAPFTAWDLADLGCPLVGVFGNNDGDRAALQKAFAGFATLHDPPHRLSVAGRRVVVAHERDAAEAASEGADVLIYGHSHRAEVIEESPLRLNPGETCGWVTGRSSVALLDPGSLTVAIVDL